jgi:hypothetical protein
MYRCLLAIFCLPLVASAINTAEVITPAQTVIDSDANPHADDGTVWSGFTSAQFDLRFLTVDPGKGTPPDKVFGENAGNSSGWNLFPERLRQRNLNIAQFARIVAGTRNHWSVIMSTDAGIGTTYFNENVENLDWYEPGLVLPFSVLYHPEPQQVAAEDATIRLYISGGAQTYIGASYDPPQFDLRISATPPAYNAAEFAVATQPASPVTGPTVRQDPTNPGRVLYTLSGTADAAHAGQTVYLRWRHPDALDSAKRWSAFNRLATVSGAGAWSGDALLIPAADLELDLILKAADGSQYRQHIPSITLVSAQDDANGDYASGVSDGVANILKLAVGIDPATPATQSDIVQVETVQIGGDTYGQIRYNRDPAQTTIQITPQWTPDYKASPWRSSGMVLTHVSTDVPTGIETWTARAPVANGSAYMRLDVTRRSAEKQTYQSDPDAPHAVSIDLDPAVVPISPSITGTTYDRGVVVEQTTAETYYNGGRIVTQVPTVEAVTPSIATVDAQFNIVRQGDGVATFRVTEYGASAELTQDVTLQSGTQEPDVFQSHLKGTLADHMIRQIDNRIASGMTLTGNGNTYTLQDHSTPAYTRNPGLWAADIDLTGIAPWAAGNNKGSARTLITPRHVLGCAHWRIGVGGTIRFVAADNTVVTRTVLSRVNHPDYTPYYPDFTVYTLDADVPPNIKPFRVLDDDWDDYWPSNQVRWDARIPGLRHNQLEQALSGDFSHQASSYQIPADADRAIFGSSIILYDSGNPAFAVVKDEALLTTVWTGGGGGSGTGVSWYRSGDGR